MNNLNQHVVGRRKIRTGNGKPKWVNFKRVAAPGSIWMTGDEYFIRTTWKWVKSCVFEEETK